MSDDPFEDASIDGFGNCVTIVAGRSSTEVANEHLAYNSRRVKMPKGRKTKQKDADKMY
jgi:hypothetical protein